MGLFRTFPCDRAPGATISFGGRTCDPDDGRCRPGAGPDNPDGRPNGKRISRAFADLCAVVRFAHGWPACSRRAGPG